MREVASMAETFAVRAEIEATLAAMTAYHEAGHAVIAFRCGATPDDATMVGYHGSAIASVRYRAGLDPISECVISIAGLTAETMYAEREGLLAECDGLDKDIRSGARGDLRRVADVLGARSYSRLSKKLRRNLERMVRNDLEERWATVEAIASALLREYRLDRTRLTEILEEAA
jgi:hypothetical protein